MNDIIQPKRLKLYNALKIGYLRNENKQRKRLKRFGYVLDPQLTTREYLTAYNPEKKKLIFVSNGTDFSNSVDVSNDLLVGIGVSPKNRRRVEDEKNALLKAKQKYNVNNAVLVSHSLGGNMTHFIGSKDDRIITYNPALINQKIRPNETIYRTQGDVVSAFANNAKTIDRPQDRSIFKAHNLENIKEEPIFI